MQTIAVAIVEDQKDTREGLTFLIEHARGLRCVAACASGEQALEELPSLSPDVVLLDIRLAGRLTGIDCIEPLKKLLPNQAQIVMLTDSSSPDDIFRALRQGATGYLRKTTPFDQLPDKIEEVQRGASPMSPEIARLLIQALQNPSPESDAWRKLTQRERDVIELKAQGYSEKEIAEKLATKPGTIKTHCRSIYEKLQVHSAEQAIARVFPGKKLQTFVRQIPSGETL